MNRKVEPDPHRRRGNLGPLLKWRSFAVYRPRSLLDALVVALLATTVVLVAWSR